MILTSLFDYFFKKFYELFGFDAHRKYTSLSEEVTNIIAFSRKADKSFSLHRYDAEKNER